MNKLFVLGFIFLLVVSSASAIIYSWDYPDGSLAYRQSYDTANPDIKVFNIIAVHDNVNHLCRYPTKEEIKENNFIPSSFKE